MQTQVLNVATISEKFQAQMDSGKAIIVGTKPTKNPQYVQLVIAQSIAVDSSDSASDVNSLLLGWSNKTTLMHWRNVEKSIFDKMAPKEGEEVVEAFKRLNPGVSSASLQLVEYTSDTDVLRFRKNVELPAANNRAGAKPKINPSTGEVITYNGLPVFRDVELVINAEPTHVTLRGNSSASVEEAPAM